MMTPEEAKTKWCPFAHARITEVCNCIADGCMAWRWHPLQTDKPWRDAVIKVARQIGDTSSGKTEAARIVNENRADYGLCDKPFQGWCGQAGKPEGWP